MIDAKQFATAYNAYWQTAAPTFDLFVRRANLDGYERHDFPLEAPPAPARRAVTAEFAFSKFVIENDFLQNGIARPSEADIYARAWDDVIQQLEPFSAKGLDLETALTDDEKRDAGNITERLIRFFSNNQDPVSTRPRFPGCGYIDMSEGDVILGTTLFEVKTVDRLIRSLDLRQLLTYAALNNASRTYQLDSVGIFNPRRGIYANFDLTTLCLGVSGKPPETFLSEIVETVSSGEISR